MLWRLHAAGSLLVVPQFAVAAFAFDYLARGAGGRPGAGRAAGAQVLGALARLVAGAGPTARAAGSARCG